MSGDFCNGSERYAVKDRSNQSGAEVLQAFDFFYRVARDGVNEANPGALFSYTHGWTPTSLPVYEPVDLDGYFVNIPEFPALDTLVANVGAVEGLETAPNIKVRTPSYKNAPTATIVKPTLYEPEKPGDLDASPPEYDVELDERDVPEDPDLTLPDVPTLLDITLPTLQEIELPTYEGIKPTIDVDVSLHGVDYVEPEYVSVMKDTLEAKIYDILNTGLALPYAFWQQMVDRQNSDQVIAGQRAVQTATEEWGLRGWDIPAGPLNRQIRETRLAMEGEEAKTRRDIFIKRSDLEVDNIKFAVVQGLVWEEQNLQLFNQVQDRLLRFAQSRLEGEISILNAKIAKFNAEKDFYVAEAQVHENLIRAELAKVEIFKAEIEAQGLIGQLNEQAVRIYSERVKAVQAEVDIFRARVEAVRAIYENNRAKVQVYAERVRAYETVVEAWSKEWEGYLSAVNANRNRIQLYAEENQALKVRIEGYEAETRAKSLQLEGEIQEKRLQLDAWLADIQRYEADVRKAVAEVQATVDKTRATSEASRALTDLERTKVSAIESDNRVRVEQSRAKAATETEAARIASAEIQAQMEMGLKAVESNVRALEQRIASALSAINVGASISDSVSWGFGTTVDFGCSTNYSVSVEDV